MSEERKIILKHINDLIEIRKNELLLELTSNIILSKEKIGVLILN